MKLNELVNVTSAGNKTNLSGGDLPNAYKDDASKASKEPRKKKKDVYGTGGVSAAINSQGTSDSSAGDSGGGDSGGTSTGGSSGGGGGGGE